MSMYPGRALDVSFGAICNYCRQPATQAICGEVDSFGYETINLCEQHYAPYMAKLKKDQEHGICEDCGQTDIKIIYWRDIDEGSCGRIHTLCSPCRTLRNQQYAAEFEEPDDDYMGDPTCDL